ncbi:ABZJ_00895 family protein (plasmid) [Agrobacterium sp. rho-13.3]|uniref:ABZJ_00895 family protein n=1 Tax=Agrobacterium sp. rho-13.3 TaxID=3072980 RepID=UPI002A0EBABB|nr:ABZJ_00895 family protein [Agrobacterium sp. rho-13.3]MDX8310208.1 ABZJ_00895 family protein [Agrobacterium sp. rho-13.3]
MIETSAPLTEKKLISIFALWLLGFTVLYVVADFLASLVSDVSIPGHVTSIIAVMGSSMVTGDAYFKHYGKMPSNALSWRLAVWFLVVNLALTITAVGIMAAIASLNGFSLLDMAIPSDVFGDVWLIVGVGVFVLVLDLLIARFGFSLGAKSARKFLANQAEKSARKNK